MGGLACPWTKLSSECEQQESVYAQIWCSKAQRSASTSDRLFSAPPALIGMASPWRMRAYAVIPNRDSVYAGKTIIVWIACHRSTTSRISPSPLGPNSKVIPTKVWSCCRLAIGKCWVATSMFYFCGFVWRGGFQSHHAWWSFPRGELRLSSTVTNGERSEPISNSPTIRILSASIPA